MIIVIVIIITMIIIIIMIIVIIIMIVIMIKIIVEIITMKSNSSSCSSIYFHCGSNKELIEKDSDYRKENKAMTRKEKWTTILTFL